MFHLEPGKEDSGKGKCPYDPKLNSVSALISKSLQNGGKYISISVSWLLNMQCSAPKNGILYSCEHSF